MGDINVKMADLPTSIASFVVANSDTTYTVILNSRLAHERLTLAYRHELNHIINGDYDRKYNADLIELYTHN